MCYGEVREQNDRVGKKKNVFDERLFSNAIGLNIFSPVSVFPNFDEDDSAVEAIKDEKRQSQT